MSTPLSMWVSNAKTALRWVQSIIDATPDLARPIAYLTRCDGKGYHLIGMPDDWDYRCNHNNDNRRKHD